MRKREILRSLNQTPDISANLFKKMYCGPAIASGKFRTVYEFKLSGDYVVKFEPIPAVHNIMEDFIWWEVRYSQSYAKWFCEVLWTNTSRTILVMKYLQTSYLDPAKRRLPLHIPMFFSDLHSGNYGFVGNQLKCCDYGNTLVTKHWRLNKVRARWFGRKNMHTKSKYK